ncbi:MAG: hypothetical protein ACJ790_19855, partial [Myxococcaceae bacterium]
QSVCTDKRPVGQPCSSDDVCAFGSHCVNSFCVAYATNGQSCAGNPAPVCDSLLSCQGTTCQPEYATTGEACNTNVPCVNVDSFCQNGTCVARGANGAACTSGAQCQSSSCGGTSNTCVAACWQ